MLTWTARLGLIYPKQGAVPVGRKVFVHSVRMLVLHPVFLFLVCVCFVFFSLNLTFYYTFSFNRKYRGPNSIPYALQSVLGPRRFAIDFAPRFAVQVDEKPYTFLCENQVEKDTWVAALRAVGERWRYR